MIKDTLTHAIESRLIADRPIACLLSGGLDSSLVAAIAARYLNKQNRKLATFSIGMPGATDAKYAQLVADKIGSKHTHIELREQDFLDAIKDVIWISETFDITTIRATTGQYLAAKKIADATDYKVLLIGDGSDEVCSGYLYFHKAPNPEAMHKENIKLLKNIHKYDVLRADRGIASNGLEARVPFLDSRFIDMFMSIDPSLRMPQHNMEKWLLRSAFEDEDLLPREVLFRRKEAFSDGVSSKEKSWYEVIQEHVDKNITDDTFEKMCQNEYAHHCTPPTKEALHFRLLFHSMFGKSPIDYCIDNFWLPNDTWIKSGKEPSARALSIYNTLEQ